MFSSQNLLSGTTLLAAWSASVASLKDALRTAMRWALMDVRSEPWAVRRALSICTACATPGGAMAASAVTTKHQRPKNAISGSLEASPGWSRAHLQGRVVQPQPAPGGRSGHRHDLGWVHDAANWKFIGVSRVRLPKSID